VFRVDTPLSPDTADQIYDTMAARLAEPAYRPRALFERFNIELLATTESPLDDLACSRPSSASRSARTRAA
jgi:glucuronate isomerase